MGKVLALVACLVSFSAHAKIDVSSLVTLGSSTDSEATDLTNALKKVGVKSYVDASGYETFNVNGNITMTNGAACDNAKETYSVNLKSLDADGTEVGSTDLDETDACTKTTQAEDFSALMGQWGASTLAGDCGAGHCWVKIDSIQCTHFTADGSEKAYDSCSVELGSSDQ